MSLIKRYTIGCNGNDYRRRKGLPYPVENGCKGETALPADSSSEAHRTARISGWVRHHEDMPILESNPSAGTSKQTFDLCPPCAFTLMPEIQL